MRIKLFLLFPLTFLSSSYIHAESISENENCKVLDKCICTIRPKNSNFCISIYESDVESLASYYNMTGNYTDKEDIFDDIIKYIFYIFGNMMMIESFVKPVEKMLKKIGLDEESIENNILVALDLPLVRDINKEEFLSQYTEFLRTRGEIPQVESEDEDESVQL